MTVPVVVIGAGPVGQTAAPLLARRGLRVYRFHSRVASRMRIGRVLPAGDCAHLAATLPRPGPDALAGAIRTALSAR